MQRPLDPEADHRLTVFPGKGTQRLVPSFGGPSQALMDWPPSARFRNRTPTFLYEKVYCARGRMEGFIKNHKTFLHSDRTSCHRFPANQFRLFLHSAAYVLVHAIKHIGMRGTQWTTSNFDTIQLRVLKIGARVREHATRIRFHFPTSYPLKDLMKTIVLNLDTA